MELLEESSNKNNPVKPFNIQHWVAKEVGSNAAITKDASEIVCIQKNILNILIPPMRI